MRNPLDREPWEWEEMYFNEREDAQKHEQVVECSECGCYIKEDVIFAPEGKHKPLCECCAEDWIEDHKYFAKDLKRFWI